VGELGAESVGMGGVCGLEFVAVECVDELDDEEGVDVFDGVEFVDEFVGVEGADEWDDDVGVPGIIFGGVLMCDFFHASRPRGFHHSCWYVSIHRVVAI
jgi:hypothetical protein